VKDAKKKVQVPIGGGGRSVECMVVREAEVYLVSWLASFVPLSLLSVSLFLPLASLLFLTSHPTTPPPSTPHLIPSQSQSQLDPPSSPTLLTPSIVVPPSFTSTWPFLAFQNLQAKLSGGAKIPSSPVEEDEDAEFEDVVESESDGGEKKVKEAGAASGGKEKSKKGGNNGKAVKRR